MFQLYRQVFKVCLVALLTLAALGATMDGEAAQDSEVVAADDIYEYRRPTRDGIGKIYMGREISHVMGHLGADWLERPTRQREERTDLLIRNLPLEPDSVVADIGAGTGYFSFPMAERVPDGKVLAVDIQQEMLDIVHRRSIEMGVANVLPVLGAASDPRLPEGEVDLILLVDAYHEFAFPREMGEAMVRSLRPGGKLVLIEYRGEDPNVPIKRLHKMTERQARREMKAIGLDWVETGDFLPQQHFMIFQKPVMETSFKGPAETSGLVSASPIDRATRLRVEPSPGSLLKLAHSDR